MYRIVLSTEKKLKAQRDLSASNFEDFSPHATSTMFQNKKLKRKEQLPQLRRLRKLRCVLPVVLCLPLKFGPRFRWAQNLPETALNDREQIKSNRG